jgi:hypothetical protein
MASDRGSGNAELLVELSQIGTACAEAFLAFMKARNQIRERLAAIDNRLTQLADQYRGEDRGNVDPELRCVLGDLAPRLSNSDLERQMADTAELFARKVKYLSLVCRE